MTKKLSCVLVAVLLLAGLLYVLPIPSPVHLPATFRVTAPEPTSHPPDRAYFVPNYTGDSSKDAGKIIIEEIGKAKKQVLVQAYEFTSRNIGNALLAAKERNVSVEVIFDRKASDSPFSVMRTLSKGGITCYTDGQHRIAHNKIIIIDNTVLITGSFNFTESAQKSNGENVVILHEPYLIQSYIDNWNHHREHSKEVK